MTNNITRAAKDLSGKVALLDVCCNAVSSAKEPINLGLVDKAKGCTCVPDELRDTASNAGRQRIERRLDIADRYAANLEAVVFFGLRRRRRAGGSRRRLTPDGLTPDGLTPDGSRPEKQIGQAQKPALVASMVARYSMRAR